jgi:hypothetical protein
MMYCLVIATINAYDILYTEMVSYFGTGSGNTAWIGGMVLLLLLGLCEYVLYYQVTSLSIYIRI